MKSFCLPCPLPCPAGSKKEKIIHKKVTNNIRSTSGRAVKVFYDCVCVREKRERGHKSRRVSLTGVVTSCPGFCQALQPSLIAGSAFEPASSGPGQQRQTAASWETED